MLIASYIFNTTAILYQFPYCVHLESHKPPDICIHRVPPHLQHYNTSSPSPCPLRSFLAFHKNGGAVHSFIVESWGLWGASVWHGADSFRPWESIMADMLSVNFRKPYAVGWSKEQGEQPGPAALEFHRCCSQILERVWTASRCLSPATISHPCQAHFSYSPSWKAVEQMVADTFLRNPGNSPVYPLRHKKKRKKKIWKCGVEIKRWFEKGWTQEKACLERCAGVSMGVHKPGPWERRPGTCSLHSGEVGDSQEADTKQDWPNLVTRNTPSSNDSGAEWEPSSPTFYACLKITQFLPGSKCNFKLWKLDHKKKGKKRIKRKWMQYAAPTFIKHTTNLHPEFSTEKSAGTECFCFLIRGERGSHS